MTAIHLTDREAAVRSRPGTRALTAAATAALRAPSVFNTQPWRWRIHDEVADLYADRERQLQRVDPGGMLLTLSCGTALHHAVTSLAAAGHRPGVHRLPDPADPDLLARVTIEESGRPDAAATRLYRAMGVRGTDRRPYAPRPVPLDEVTELVNAAEKHGSHLHLLRPDQVVMLTVAACRAAEAELGDPQYRAELGRWTHRPPGAGDGVPATTAVPAVPRPVPVRDFGAVAAAAGPGGRAGGGSGGVPGADAGARFAILFTDLDAPAGWLAAGEGLSAVLLTAAADGLAVAPMSDVVEVPVARAILCDLLAGVGHPVLALRIGRRVDDGPVPPTPRRPPEETVQFPGGTAQRLLP